MFACLVRISAFAGCLASISFAEDAVLPEQNPADTASPIEGLWQAWWGGGVVNGVGRQPVLAELFVHGDRIELRHLPNLGSLSGRVRLDAERKRMHVTRKEAAADALNFAYEIKDNKLTLIHEGKAVMVMDRFRTERDPLAHTQVEIASATGIDDAGDLLITRFTVLKGEVVDAPHFHPHEQRHALKEASVLLMQKAGLKTISVNEARALIHEPTPVVVAHRYDDRPLPPAASELFSELGPAQPNSDAVLKTLSRVLRPGTLIFILPPQQVLP